MNTELVRLKKISEITSLSVVTLRKMIKNKQLKAVNIGGIYYVRPIDYADFMLNLECNRLGLNFNDVKKIIQKY